MVGRRSSLFQRQKQPKKTKRNRRLFVTAGLVVVIATLIAGVVSYPFILFHSYNRKGTTHGDDSSKSLSLSSQGTTLGETQNNLLVLPGCLTEACINATATTFLARTYPNRTDRAWCLNQSSSSSSTNKGILLVKVPKGASSTAAGVAIRIARRQHCQAIQWRHKAASASTYGNRSRNQDDSFLFTTIRDPAARAVSTIFFHIVSRLPKFQPNTTTRTNTSTSTSETAVVSDEFLLRYLKEFVHPHQGAISQGQGGFQLRYTSMEEIPVNSFFWNNNNNAEQGGAGAVLVQQPGALVRRVNETIHSYDFILVTERMDESLVAMSLVMGIPVGDVLVTASKVAGSRYHLAHLPGNVFQCIPTVKSVVSPVVQAYLESDAWRAVNYGDYLLHQAASASLDRTIDQVIGRERFQRALAEYRHLRSLEQAQCAPHVHFPCSNEGIPQPALSKKSCYLPFFDFGCGYVCIDGIISSQEANSVE